MDELLIDSRTLKKGALIIRAFNHKLRLQLIQFIHANNRLTVTQIYVHHKLEQSVASQHLAILREAGLVLAEREGKQIFYSVNYARMQEVQQQCACL